MHLHKNSTGEITMATAENSTGAETGNHVVGKVVILYGTVKAIASDGTERVLALNNPIFAYDRIITESDGRVSIVIDDGVQTQIDLGRMSDVVIDEDIFEGASPDEIAAATAEVEEIQEALLTEETFDPTVELEAPAAGGEAAAGGGLVVPEFERVEPPSEITSGAETTGPAFDTVDPIPGISEEVPGNPPLAEPNTGGDTEGDIEQHHLLTGNVLEDDEPLDDPSKIVLSITINGVTHNVPSGGSVGPIETELGGFITIDSEGNWEYITPPYVDHDDDEPDFEEFEYTMTNSSGPPSTSTLTIEIIDTAPEGPTDTNLEVVEDDLLVPSDFESTDSASNSFTLEADPLESLEFSGAIGAITGDYADGDITWVVSNSGHTLTGTVDTDPGASIVLNLTGIDLDTGAFTVDVTMSDEFAHTAPSSGAEVNDFTITGVEVVGTDIDGDPATG
jgi:hypothetical protein